MATYKVTFLGLSVIGSEEESLLLEGLQTKFNLTPEKAENMLHRVPIVVKKGVSQEEAEKYVKAFEEIGGKISVEQEDEEPISRIEVIRDYEESHSPEPAPSPKPTTAPKPSPVPRPTPASGPEIQSPLAHVMEPERKPSSAGRMVCPQCEFDQPESNECIKCGIIISKFRQYQEKAKSMEGQIKEISTTEHTPWENKEGFLQAYFRTVRDSLFTPVKFFKRVSPNKGIGSAFLCAMISGIIGAAAFLFWFQLLFSGMLPSQTSLPVSFLIVLLVIMIIMPFVLAGTILIQTIFVHLGLIITGGNRKGFGGTFLAVCYSMNSYLCYIIPLIGMIFTPVYFIILMIIGVKEIQGTSTGKAVFAVLFPLILGATGGILAAIFFVMLMRGGIGV